MRVTIRSIAEAANVSRGTVDKVLHDRPGVSDEVRERVRKIADDMGYIVNPVGKALAYSKNPIKIGVIILSKEDYLFKQILKGVKIAEKEFVNSGIGIECCIMDKISIEEQVKRIRELEKKNVKAIAFSPIDDEIIRNEMKRLSQKNIKFVTFNTDISEADRLCFVGQDSEKSGRVAGRLMASLINGIGSIAILSAADELKTIKGREEGFRKLISEEYPNIKILDTINIQEEGHSSYVETIDLFKKQPNISGIFMVGAGISGAGKAIKFLNKKNVKFVSYDTIPETLELINDRIIDFTITQEPEMQGYLPIKILYDYLFLNKVPEEDQIYTKLEIKVKENL